MKEENEEYLEAVQNDNLIEIADALGDMMYILCGTIIEHGLQHKIEAFDEIQRNMSKLIQVIHISGGREGDERA
jgi:predicted HAD superfamily Cof-like phosphohydrolase